MPIIPTTRRHFLQGTLATTGLALTSSVFARPGLASLLEPSGSPLELRGVVFEPARAQSATFAAHAERLGLPTFGIAGDITPVWAQLVELWRATPVAIGGLTTQIPLLLLEQSARDHGLRVVLRAEHRPSASGAVSHVLTGPAEVIRTFGSEATRQRDFGACVARAVVQCPAGSTARDTVSLQTRAIPDQADEPSLYSWVLAPRPAHTRGVSP